tara:strand:+ start:3090 stop:4142 length:1053 start_codon:yes stop_codon:yes gene_type:complete
MAKNKIRKTKKLKGLHKAKYFIGGLIGGFLGKGQAKGDIKTATGEMDAAKLQREQLAANQQTLSLSPETEKLKEGLGGTEIQRRQEAAERTRAGAMGAATRGGTRVDPFAAAQAGSQQEGQLAQQQAAAQRSGLQSAATERGKLRTMQETREVAGISQAEKERLEGRTDVMAGQRNLEASRQQIYGGVDAAAGMAMGNMFGKRGAVVKGGLKERLKQRAIQKAQQQRGQEQGEQEVPRDEAEVTPGEFSHEKNPIDLVKKDEEGAPEKIGEMTGGEAIVPPKNVKQIRHLIREKNGKGLVNLMDNLLTKWDKESEENNNKEAKRGAVHTSVHKPRLPKFNYGKRRSSIFN